MGNSKYLDSLNKDEYNGNKMFLRQGGFASYGSCFSVDGAYVQSKEVTGELKEQIEKAILCADSTDAKVIEAC